MEQGVIKFYNKSEGKTYGFITSGDKDYFFFKTDIPENYIPQKDEKVEFEIVQGRKGEQAKNIKFVK